MAWGGYSVDMALPLFPAMVGYVLANLRPCDAAEVWPVTPRGILPHDLATALCTMSPLGRVFLHDDIPAGVVGAAPQQPGVWSPWMFATTDGWPHVWRSMARYIRHELTPEMIGRGCHRAHVQSIVGHPDAGKFLRYLGFRQEAPLQAFGRDREDYTQWVYIVPETV